MATIDLSGNWTSRYTYHEDENGSEHTVVLSMEGNLLTGQSTPQPDGSSISLQLDYDPENHTLTGTWREATSPTSEYKGAVFHGALQLILNTENSIAEGRWVGFNSSCTKVNTGRWSLERK